MIKQIGIFSTCILYSVVAVAQAVGPTKDELDAVASVMSRLAIYRHDNLRSFNWDAATDQNVQRIDEYAEGICLTYDTRLKPTGLDATCKALLSGVFLSRFNFYRTSSRTANLSSSGSESVSSETVVSEIRSIDRACRSIWGKAENLEIKFILADIHSMCMNRALAYVGDLSASKGEDNAIYASDKNVSGCEQRFQRSRSEVLKGNQALSACTAERERLVEDNEKLRRRLISSASPVQPIPQGSPTVPGTAASDRPNVSASAVGSSIVFTANSSASREFRCSIAWTISYTEFGQGKTKSTTKDVIVPAKHMGTVMTDQTTYANLRISSLNYSCA